MKYDVVVIGSGVGGYPAAILLASRGFRVAVVEEHLIGGECTNYGCVPSKTWYSIAEALRTLRKVGALVDLDWKEVTRYVEKMVENARSGVEYLLQSYGVDVYRGRGVLKDRDKIAVVQSNGERKQDVIEASRVILALGTDPKPLPNIGFDGRKIVSNREIFTLENQPEDIAIVGGGVIGVEIANIFSNIGVKTVLIEKDNHILPFLDPDASSTIESYLKKNGVIVVKGVTVNKTNVKDGKLVIELSNGMALSTDIMLIAVGRKPKTEGVNLSEVGIKLNEKGFIIVNEKLETTVGNIYAVGDVVGEPLLAHKAIIESIAVANIISNKEPVTINYKLIPLTIFSGLEVASIGYTEKELASANLRYVKYKLPINYLSAVRIKGDSTSFIKILISEDHSKVYGIHIVSPSASEVVSAFIPLALGKLTIKEMAVTPYPHLTVGESLREIAEYIIGEPIHYVIKK
ncbi:dihydrolipoyl dehydrogenase family protein [Thermogladius sp. 4427co]|uniref:dihydrolipoyl dehydrogenase family protein n=1 Tax=Thermogladius sp. 4427co TaxID=3450718 RepID=UPI003F78B5BD